MAPGHPLCGRRLEARSFKRVEGVLHLVVMLPDGSPATIRAEATDVFGETLIEAADAATVLSVEGLRRLRLLVDAAKQRRAAAGKAVSR